MKESHKKRRKENRLEKLPDIKQCEKGFMQMRKDIFGTQVSTNANRMSTKLCSLLLINERTIINAYKPSPKLSVTERKQLHNLALIYFFF